MSIVLGLVRRPNQYTVVDGHLWFGSKVPRGQSDDKLFGVGVHTQGLARRIFTVRGLFT